MALSSENPHNAVTRDASNCLQGVMDSREKNKDSRLELQVRLPAGVKLRVKLRDEATVTELKMVIEMRSGIPSDLHAFYYGNTELKDETRIGDMAIPDGGLLVLSVPSWWNKLVCSSMKGEIEQTCARVSVKMNQITREERQFVAAFIGASRGNHSLLFNLTAGRKQLNIHRTVKHSGRSLLHAAVAGGDLSCVVNILVNGGACLIEQPDENGETPLSVAKKLNNEGIEQLLGKYLEMRRQENQKLEENNVWKNQDSEGLEVVIPHDTTSDAEEPDTEAEKEVNPSAVSTAEFSKKKIAHLIKSKWKKRKQIIEIDAVEKEAKSHEVYSADKVQEVLDADGGNSPEHTQSDPCHMAEDGNASGLTSTTTSVDTMTMTTTTTTGTTTTDTTSTAVAKSFEFSKEIEQPQTLTDYTGKEPETKSYDANEFNITGVERNKSHDSVFGEHLVIAATNSFLPEYNTTSMAVAKEFELAKDIQQPQSLTDYTGKESKTKSYDPNEFNISGVERNKSHDSEFVEHLVIADETRPRSNSEPSNFKPEDEEAIPSHSQMDNQNVNSNRVLDEAISNTAEKDSPTACIDEMVASTERLRLHRGCLPHPKFSDDLPHYEEKDIVIMENVIELDKNFEKPSKHGDTQCPGEGECVVHFPSLYVQREPDTRDVLSPTHVTPTRTNSATQRGSFPGRNSAPKEAGRQCPREKPVRTHSGPRRVSSLKTTRDSSGLGREGLPVPHPPARRIKSMSPTVVTPHGQYMAKPEAPRLSQKEGSPDHLFHRVPNFQMPLPKSAPNSPEQQRRDRAGSLPPSPSSLISSSFTIGDTRTRRGDSLHAGIDKHHGLLLNAQVHAYLLSKYKARETLPWNQWKKVERLHGNDEHLSGDSDEDDEQNSTTKHQTGSAARKSFNDWLAEKEADIYRHRARLEEEANKAEKMKKDEENLRKRTHQTHDEWLEEKIKREKEMCERYLESRHDSDADKKERQKEAERKFQKWLLNKAEEEMREEERQRKAMEKRFEEIKKKKGLASPAVSRVKLCRTRSLPLGSKKPVKHSSALACNQDPQNVH